jgi:hypothetical protein
MKNKLILISFLFLCLGCAASLVGTNYPDEFKKFGFYSELMEGNNQVLWLNNYAKVEFNVFKGRGYIIIDGKIYVSQPAVLKAVAVAIMNSDFIIIAHVIGSKMANVSSSDVGCPFSVFIDDSQYDFSKFKYITFGFG